MKIAIEDLLAAMDLAAARALRQQQFNLHYAGFTLTGKEAVKNKPLLVANNVLEIKPKILNAANGSVTIKIAVMQQTKFGNLTPLLSSQLLFVKVPVSSLLSKKTAATTHIFTALSHN